MLAVYRNACTVTSVARKGCGPARILGSIHVNYLLAVLLLRLIGDKVAGAPEMRRFIGRRYDPLQQRRKGMSGSERLDPKSGPLGNLGQACFSGFDVMMKGYEPALRGVGRWNLELMGLMTRRTQAWLEMPARAARCRTPQDLINEQMRFWQTAAQQYADGSHRLATALGACAVMPGLNGAWGGQAVAPTRDYITFPEPLAAEEGAQSKRGDERKAA